MKPTCFLLGLAAVVAGGCAGGADPAGTPTGAAIPGGVTPAQAIARLDTDGDGKVGKAEYLAFQAEQFPEADRDGDGALSAEEFRNAQPSEQARSNAGRSFGMFHRGGGPGMTPVEWAQFHNFVFNRFVDTDRDGFMSGDEWLRVVGR